MATLTVNNVTLAGSEITSYTPSTGGDEFANDGRTILRITNGHASNTVTVTAAGQGECNQGFTHSLEIEVDAGESEVAGPFDQHRFNDEDGMVQLTYSGERSDSTIELISQ